MTVSAIAPPVLDRRVLAQHYTLRNVEETIEFVNVHSFLLPLLLEAPTHIQCVFGVDFCLTLEVSHDPEAADAQLFIIILTQETQEEGLSKLRALDSGWWRTALRRTQGKLSLDMEIVDAI